MDAKAGLRAIEPKRDPDVVRFLESALERARGGQTTGILILEQDATGLSYCVAGIKDRYQTTGWLFKAMHRLQTDAP